MSKRQSIPITSTSQLDIEENDYIQHISNNDNNIRTVQDVKQAIEKEEKEIKRPVLAQDMGSETETATKQKLPLMTTGKPWYSIELINIHKKEHILDPRDYSMLKKSSILTVVAIGAAMYVIFIYLLL